MELDYGGKSKGKERKAKGLEKKLGGTEALLFNCVRNGRMNEMIIIKHSTL